MIPRALPEALRRPLERLQQALAGGAGEEIEAAGAAWEEAVRIWAAASAPQAEALEAVLEIQQQLIAACRQRQSELSRILSDLGASRRGREAYRGGGA